jgi:Flp pilus assembly protein TadG
MRGPVSCSRQPELREERGGRRSRPAPGGRRGEAGSAAVEFALVTTFVASLAFGTAALIGAGMDQPLHSVTSVLSAITQTRG